MHVFFGPSDIMKLRGLDPARRDAEVRRLFGEHALGGPSFCPHGGLESCPPKCKKLVRGNYRSPTRRLSYTPQTSDPSAEDRALAAAWVDTKEQARILRRLAALDV